MTDLAERKRPDPFRRDPGAPFDSYEREQYAKARAKGGSITAACQVAGISGPSGTAFEKHPEMRARIRELRDGAEDFVGVSLGYMLGKLKEVIEDAHKAEEFKSAIDGIKVMAQLLEGNSDAAANMARALPPEVQGKALQKRLTDAFAPKKLPKEKAEYVAPPVPAEEDEEAAE